MNDSRKAVFLSYASQDAEAAKRIAEALRAAGVEVWFDQNELVGGDAWDAKIRGHIRECALLIPVISKTTQGRREAYFRLEWKLADERTHLMAKGTPFLLPLTIDDTTERGALVPDSFVAVQWTKAPGGELPPAFVRRVVRLLAPGPAEIEPTATARPVASASARSAKSLAWVAVVLVALAAAGGAWWLTRSAPAERPPAPVAPPIASIAVPRTESRKLAEQAMQLLNDPNLNRESSWLADELSERALKLDAGDAEVWAVAALASCNLAANIYDTSSARREKAREQSQRASQLDRNSVRAALAVARYEERWGSSEESLSQLKQLHQRAPADQEVMHFLIRAAGDQKDEATAQATLAELRAAPRTPLFWQTLWFEALRLRSQGRFVEAEKVVLEMMQEPSPVRGGYYERLIQLLAPWHAHGEFDELVQKLPPRFLQEPAFGSLIAHRRLCEGDAQGAINAMSRVPPDYLEEFNVREPKGLAIGWAHAMAGRTMAAQSEWRSALSLIEERLRADPRVRTYLGQRVLLLALLGQRDAAQEALRLWTEMNGDNAWTLWNNRVLLHSALGESELAFAALEKQWPSLHTGRRMLILPLLRSHPAYASLRRDPRCERFLADARQELDAEWRRQQSALTPRAAAPLSADEKSVAVLAFANLSSDKEQEYFSDGISEELLNVLAKVPGLKVTARTSSFYFKGKETPIPEIAQKLGVAYVVEGSVRKSGDKVRITAQLIKAADGFHVWSDTFTRDLKDIFAVQDEMAALIARNLQLRIGTNDESPARTTVSAVSPEELDAYRLYWEARQAWNRRNPAGYDRAEALLEQAIKLAPRFAKAHAALADVWELRGEWDNVLGPFANRRSELVQRIQQKVEVALALDPVCAEAYASRGLAAWNTWEFEIAEKSQREAIRLNPNYASAHQWLGRVLMIQGKLDEALRSLAKAAELDPLSPRILDNYAWALVHAGRYADALAQLERAIALQPDAVQPLSLKARILAEQGHKAEAAALERSVPRGIWISSHFRALALGLIDQPESRAELEALLADRNYVTRFTAQIALGRTEEALASLTPEKFESTRVDLLLFDPFYDRVRSDPRFLRALEAITLAPAHERAQVWRAAHRPEKREIKP